MLRMDCLRWGGGDADEVDREMWNLEFWVRFIDGGEISRDATRHSMTRAWDRLIVTDAKSPRVICGEHEERQRHAKHNVSATGTQGKN